MLEHTGSLLFTRSVETVQVNVGLRCNKQCVHCHVRATPNNREMMEWGTMQLVLTLARQIQPQLLDITGGAPELNPFLPRFIASLNSEGHSVQVRTNLTVLLESGMETMGKLFREAGVKLVASLPCYLREEVDSQRGPGTFDQSIHVLKQLNDLGYGRDPHLQLDLVYNPEGPFLPPNQSELEAEYKAALDRQYGIVFDRLITITNMPIGRFLEQLQKDRTAVQYTQQLREAFNPHTIDKLMCQHQINIGWDGSIYNCDFNLALGQRLSPDVPHYLRTYAPPQSSPAKIVTADHCFGCTAGDGSSCEGALDAT
jgi:radical SAM/Cys-rich protein